MKVTSFLRDLMRCQKGATAIEYGLLAALIAIAIVTAVTSVGASVSSVWTDGVEAKVTEVL